MSVKQLSQWITNTKLLFKTNRSYKNNNRKITEYFGKDSAREDNIPKIDLINKMISGKDTTNNKPNSNNYLNNKNKKLFRTSGKNIDNHIVTLGRNTKRNIQINLLHYYQQLRIPIYVSKIIKRNKIILKKHGPANKEM